MEEVRIAFEGDEERDLGPGDVEGPTPFPDHPPRVLAHVDLGLPLIDRDGRLVESWNLDPILGLVVVTELLDVDAEEVVLADSVDLAEHLALMGLENRPEVVLDEENVRLLSHGWRHATEVRFGHPSSCISRRTSSRRCWLGCATKDRPLADGEDGQGPVRSDCSRRRSCR